MELKETFKLIKLRCQGLEEMTISADLELTLEELEEIHETAIEIANHAYLCIEKIYSDNQA